MNELLESLDATVFTSELKESISEQFNLAVETTVKDLNEIFIVEKTAELEVEYTNKIEERIQELEEKAEEYMASLEEKVEDKKATLEEEIKSFEDKKVELEEKADAYKTLIEEKAEEYIEIKMQEMLDNVDKYLDRVIEEFVAEAAEKLDESLKDEKADMIIEAFDAMLVATGVEVSKIVEAKDNSEVEQKLKESIEKYDSLIEENIELKANNEKLLKAGIISELKEGLTLVEAQRFERLANLVDFSTSDKYLVKLETIKESFKTKAPVVEAKVEETVIVEDAKVQEIQKPNAPIWSHLV